MKNPSIPQLLTQTPALHDCFYVVNVAAAIYHAGKYLIITRGLNETNAPGTLSLPGGKIERAGQATGIVEQTLRREVREETSVEMQAGLVYVRSKAFTTHNGMPVVDLMFLARYASGVPHPSADAEPGEIAGVAWMALEEVLGHPLAPAWTRTDLRDAEAMRQMLGWE